MINFSFVFQFGNLGVGLSLGEEKGPYTTAQPSKKGSSSTKICLGLPSLFNELESLQPSPPGLYFQQCQTEHSSSRIILSERSQRYRNIMHYWGQFPELQCSKTVEKILTTCQVEFSSTLIRLHREYCQNHMGGAFLSRNLKLSGFSQTNWVIIKKKL